MAQVFGLAKAMVGDGDAAQDITEHVYQQAWHAAIDARPPAEGAKSWLVAQAHRRAAEYLCAHRSADAEGPKPFMPVTTLPALDLLDDPSRDLLVLVYYRGYTCHDAAVLLNLPTDTAHSRLHAALRVLAQAPGSARESTSPAASAT